MARVVVITGASAGLGRAIARRFAKEGATLGLVARGEDGLEGARREAEAAGCRAVAISADVADEAALERAARRFEEELGPIDVWVNDAMTSVFARFIDMAPQEFDRVVAVTFLGYVNGTRAALRRMLPRNRGTIVQVSSALAFRSIPLQSAYCASKHAIKGFTESLRTELLHDGSAVRLSMVHMPALNTPQFSWVRSRLPRKPQPVPPIFDPDVGARAVVRAARSGRRSVTVGFPTFKALVAEKFAPGLADRYLARTGFDSQQTEEKADPRRVDNLFTPVPGDHGARGDFTSRSRPRSGFTWLSENRRWLAAGAGALGLGALLRRI